VEELGVDFGKIKMKVSAASRVYHNGNADAKQTLAVLNPFGRMNQDIMDDSDVAGPILFFLIFGTSLLVRRRTTNVTAA
jgi:hypothetical protein